MMHLRYGPCKVGMSFAVSTSCADCVPFAHIPGCWDMTEPPSRLTNGSVCVCVCARVNTGSACVRVRMIGGL